MSRLVVKGAREHNLRNVDLDLPRDAMIVFTGLSGSGKSSLAFDTIFAEGQRRYVESLSAYARQFLGQVDKPDVDFIEGLSPAVSIDQKSTSKNPRSTVGTITEIYDYMRLLWARVGRPHCPVCGEPVTKQTPQQIVDQLLELAGRHPLPGPGPRGPRPQGRIRRPLQGTHRQGLLPGPGGRRARPAERSAQAGQAVQAHHRSGGGPPRGQGRHQPAPDRLRRNRPRPGRGPRPGRIRRPRRGRPRADPGVLRTPRLPQRAPPGHRRDRAALLLLQQPVRRLLAPAAASAPSWKSTRNSSSPTRSSRSPRGPSRRGRWAPPPRSTGTGCSAASPRSSASP